MSFDGKIEEGQAGWHAYWNDPDRSQTHRSEYTDLKKCSLEEKKCTLCPEVLLAKGIPATMQALFTAGRRQ